MGERQEQIEGLLNDVSASVAACGPGMRNSIAEMARPLCEMHIAARARRVNPQAACMGLWQEMYEQDPGKVASVSALSIILVGALLRATQLSEEAGS